MDCEDIDDLLENPNVQYRKFLLWTDAETTVRVAPVKRTGNQSDPSDLSDITSTYWTTFHSRNCLMLDKLQKSKCVVASFFL